MSDSIFPPPSKELAPPPTPSKAKKWFSIGSHLLAFLSGFVGGGHTPEILKGAGDLLGGLAK